MRPTRIGTSRPTRPSWLTMISWTGSGRSGRRRPVGQRAARHPLAQVPAQCVPRGPVDRPLPQRRVGRAVGVGEHGVPGGSAGTMGCGPVTARDATTPSVRVQPRDRRWRGTRPGAAPRPAPRSPSTSRGPARTTKEAESIATIGGTGHRSRTATACSTASSSPNPHGATTTRSGGQLGQLGPARGRPTAPGRARPPAGRRPGRTSSGTQCPARYGGSIHSSTSTRGRCRAGHRRPAPRQPPAQRVDQRPAAGAPPRRPTARSRPAPRRPCAGRSRARRRVQPMPTNASSTVPAGSAQTRQRSWVRMSSGSRRGERGGVQGVERQARPGPVADHGVDLGRGQPARQHGVDHDGAALPDARRPVALVGHGDQVVGQPDRGGDLGGRRQQRRYPHPCTVGPVRCPVSAAPARRSERAGPAGPVRRPPRYPRWTAPSPAR